MKNVCSELGFKIRLIKSSFFLFHNLFQSFINNRPFHDNDKFPSFLSLHTEHLWNLKISN